jgi:tetratricopeptide (TPR) repeat protein
LVEGLLLLVIAGALVAFLTVFWGARGSPAQRMTELSDRFQSSFVMSGGTTATRFEIWKGCFHMISDRPLLGFGPDQLIDWFPRYRTIRYTQLEGEMTMPDRAHNDVIQIAVNVGIFGLLAYFWMLAALALAVHRHLKENQDPLVLGLAAAIVGYFIQNLFSIAIIGITSVYWILIAVLAALVARDRIRAKEKVSEVMVKAGIPVALKTILVLLLLAVAVVAGRIATIPQEADVYYYLGNYASRTGAQNMKMMDLFVKASQTNPYRSVYRQTLASIYSEKARISNDREGLMDSIRIVEEGLKINPRDEDLAVRLADSYLNYAGSFDPTWLPKAEKALMRTVDIDPIFAHPRIELNNLYISRRQFDKVIDNAYWVLQVEPGNQEALYQMAFSYENMGRLDLAGQIYRRLYNLNPEYPGVKDALDRLTPK